MKAFAAWLGLALFVSCSILAAQGPSAPRFRFDPDWPKPLPNKWKLGGVTGLAIIAVDSKGNLYTGEVWNGERVQRFVPAR